MGKRRIPHKIEDGIEYKWCRNDSHWVELSLFYKSKRDVDGYNQICKLCIKKLNQDNINIIRQKRKEQYWKNVEKNRKATAQWISNNKDRHKQYKKEYYIKNKERFAQKHKEWGQKNEMSKYYSDINFRLKKILRSGLRSAIQRSWRKGKTLNLLGCSVEQLKQYLENKFDINMSWENYGSYWHIDHIRPCALFDLSDPEQQKKCFHYTNLQPLEAKENIRKGAKI